MERRLSRVSKCLPNVILGRWKVWWPHDQRRLTQALQLLASVAHRELPRLAVKALDVGSVYKREATVAVVLLINFSLFVFVVGVVACKTFAATSIVADVEGSSTSRQASTWLCRVGEHSRGHKEAV